MIPSREPSTVENFKVIKVPVVLSHDSTSAYYATEEEIRRAVEASYQLEENALTLRRQANSHRKISRLPKELTAEIFHQVRDIEGCRWLRLQLVCWQWRELALSTATLWSKIPVKDNKTNIERDLVLLFLARSKQAKLDVDQSGWHAASSPMRVFEHHHLLRLRSLCLLDLTDAKLQDFLSERTFNLPTLTALTLKRSQRGSTRKYAALLRRTQFPELRFLSVTNVVVDANSSVLPQLTDLVLEKVRINGVSLAVILSKCSDLKKLVMHDMCLKVPSQGRANGYNARVELRFDRYSLNDLGSDMKGSLDSLQSLFISEPSFAKLRHHLSALVFLKLPKTAQQQYEVQGKTSTLHNPSLSDEELADEKFSMTKIVHDLVRQKARPVVDTFYTPTSCDIYVYVHGKPRSWPDFHFHCGVLAYSDEPDPRSSTSYLDQLGHMLQGLYIKDLAILYFKCAPYWDSEDYWRKFLTRFPELLRLRVSGFKNRKMLGAELIVEALRPCAARRDEGSLVEGAVMCRKLSKLVIDGFCVQDPKGLHTEVFKMTKVRRALGIPIKHVEVCV
ncbi:hypothetical protein C8Q74DRAFT_1441807 [Fomes fomentarius]|nr:hypothetical protein C8Q74DRAFT_1441807 [Fomes fomentarius]